MIPKMATKDPVGEKGPEYGNQKHLIHLEITYQRSYNWTRVEMTLPESWKP